MQAITVKTYAQQNGVSPSTVYRRIREGKLDSVSVDGKAHVFAADVPREPDLTERAEGGIYTDRWGVLLGDWHMKNPDELVALKGIETYGEMVRRHPQVKAALRFKQLSVISPGWAIQPHAGRESDEATATAKEKAEFIEDVLNGVCGQFDDVLMQVLSALQYGFSVTEKVYRLEDVGQWSGKVVVDRFAPKPPKTFDFALDEFGNIKENGLIQYKHTYRQKELDPQKFIIFSHAGETGNPYGVSDLRPAYKYYFGSDILAGFWFLSMERFADPLAIGKVPRTASASVRDGFEEILKRLQQKGVVVLNDDQAIELVERQVNGYAHYERTLKYCDMMIARSMLLPDLLTSEGSRVGSKALGQVHGDAFVLVLEHLGGLLAEVINEQVIRELIDWNFTTPGEYPTFAFNAYSEEDQQSIAEMFEGLVDKQIVAPTEAFIRERLNMPPREDEAEPPGGVEMQAFSESFRAKRKLEQKVDIGRVTKRLDRIEGLGKEKLESVIDTQKQSLLSQIQDGATPKTIAIPDVTDFRRVMEGVLVTATVQGFNDGAREVRKAGVRFQAEPLGGIDPDDALNALRDDIDFPVGLRELFADEAEALANEHSARIVNAVKRILAKGLQRGTPLQGIMRSVSMLFDGFLETGEIRDGGQVEAHRVETVVRTSMIEAYNTGRVNLYRSENVRASVPAVLYSAIIDSRTTEFCRSWDGTVLELNDPRLDEVVPPNHFRCRSLLVPITKNETYTITETLPTERPASGFEI